MKEITKHIKRYYNKSPRPKDILPGAHEGLRCETAELTSGVQAAMQKYLHAERLDGN